MNKVYLVQDGKAVFEVSAGQRAVFSPKLGKKYLLSQDASGKSPIEDIVAVKKGNHLVLMLPDGIEITINNFYLDCSQNLCSIEANKNIITTMSGDGSPATGDNSLVYAEGNAAVVQSIVKGNDNLIDAINQYLPEHQTPELSTSQKAIQTVNNGPVGDTVSTLKSVSSVVGGVGPGLLIAAGGVLLAGAAGGGGGGSSSSTSTNNVIITSKSSFDVNENTTAVGTLTSNQAQATTTWSLVKNETDSGLSADNSLFNINSSTGEVTFKAAPDFEAEGTKHTYHIQVMASHIYPSGTSYLTTTAVQSITITDKDVVIETPPTLGYDSSITSPISKVEALNAQVLVSNVPSGYYAEVTLTDSLGNTLKKTTGTSTGSTIPVTFTLN